MNLRWALPLFLLSLACDWPADTARRSIGSALTFEFGGAATLDERNTPRGGPLESYRGRMIAALDTDPRDPIALLLRQRRLFEGGGMYHELPLYDRIIEGSYGEIRAVSCLEGLLYEHHLDELTRRRGRVVTEFLAFILRRAGGVRVLYTASDSDGSASAAPLMAALRSARAEGWTFEATLHNHPFAPSREDIVGTTIPSARDEETSRGWHESFGLRRMVITNGFSTWETEL